MTVGADDFSGLLKTTSQHNVRPFPLTHHVHGPVISTNVLPLQLIIISYYYYYHYDYYLLYIFYLYI
jgi:hypothetical protein